MLFCLLGNFLALANHVTQITNGWQCCHCYSINNHQVHYISFGFHFLREYLIKWWKSHLSIQNLYKLTVNVLNEGNIRSTAQLKQTVDNDTSWLKFNKWNKLHSNNNVDCGKSQNLSNTYHVKLVITLHRVFIF